LAEYAKLPNTMAIAAPAAIHIPTILLLLMSSYLSFGRPYKSNAVSCVIE
jgi:hypothetical protein